LHAAAISRRFSGHKLAMEIRTLLLGDWHPVVRDPLDLMRVAFVAGAAVYVAVSGSSVINLIVSSAAVVGVRFVALPRPYELGFILAMALTGWGDALGLYDRFAHYDRLVHFLVPFELAPVIYILLARMDVLPDLHDTRERRHRLGVFVVTLALGAAVERSGRSSNGAPTILSGRISSTARPTRSETSSRIRPAPSSGERSWSCGASTGGNPSDADRRARSVRRLGLLAGGRRDLVCRGIGKIRVDGVGLLQRAFAGRALAARARLLLASGRLAPRRRGQVVLCFPTQLFGPLTPRLPAPGRGTDHDQRQHERQHHPRSHGNPGPEHDAGISAAGRDETDTNRSPGRRRLQGEGVRGHG
jgi:hypothetical protein